MCNRYLHLRLAGNGSPRLPLGSLFYPYPIKFGYFIQEVIILCRASGYRNRISGALNNVGTNGNSWSSAPSGVNASNLNFNATNVNPLNSNNRANGFPVRCVSAFNIN